MISSFKALACIALGGILVACIHDHATAGTDTAIEAQVGHIQTELLPPVLVKGEPIQFISLADRMASLHVPGVSIAVVHGGKLEWVRAFGVTNLGGPAVTPDTLFQAASISKPITAMAALHLADIGRLDLDADVNTYLKSWKVPANSFTEGHVVTLRQLLTHTAGMTVHGFDGYVSGAPVPTLQQILDGEAPANSPPIRVDVPPSSQFRYSGGGYVVVAQLLDDVTGKPFPKLMQESVLGPLGMTHSSYEQPLPADRLSLAAMPHDEDGKPIKGGPHTYPELAPDGLWTTPSDLARYVIEVQRSFASKSNLVLSTQMTRQMLTEVRDRQGLGPQVSGSAKRPYFEHGGANDGYRCYFFAYDSGDGIVIMTNGDNGWDLIEDIRRTVAHDYGWPDLQPPMRELENISAAQFDHVAGTYRSAPAFAITFTREGDRYFAQATDDQQEEIFPEGAGAYFTKRFDRQFFFDMDDQGKTTRLIIRQRDAADLSAKRVDDAEAKLIEKRLAAGNRRFKTQTAQPGGEEALRRHLSELALGKPDYDLMLDDVAQAVREQLDRIQKDLTSLGDVSSVTFERVAPEGFDIYEVRFANGEWKVSISLAGPHGKTRILGFRPV
jgi:CubicO group peptidase (beta-lactamase class C family)